MLLDRKENNPYGTAIARSRLLALLTIAILALFLLTAVDPGHLVVHAQRAASASQAAANASTVAISVTIGANTGQTFEASHVALGGQSAAQQGTGTGGQGQFTGSPITVDRLVDPTGCATSVQQAVNVDGRRILLIRKIVGDHQQGEYSPC